MKIEDVKETPEDKNEIVDVEAQRVVNTLDAYQDYQRENRGNHLTSDEY